MNTLAAMLSLALERSTSYRYRITARTDAAEAVARLAAAETYRGVR